MCVTTENKGLLAGNAITMATPMKNAFATIPNMLSSTSASTGLVNARLNICCRTRMIDSLPGSIIREAGIALTISTLGG